MIYRSAKNPPPGWRTRRGREEKAVLWQLFTGSASGSGNPYSTRVGKQVAKELERAREEAKE